MEKDRQFRYCQGHAPWLGGVGKPLPTELVPRKERVVATEKPHPSMLPLICVYRSYDLVRDRQGNVLRVVFNAPICAQHALRRFRGDRSEPRYPNRFGEPLCEAHRIYANDLHAFPDVTDAAGSWARSELDEKQESCQDELVQLMHQSHDESSSTTESMKAARLLLSNMSGSPPAPLPLRR